MMYTTKLRALVSSRPAFDELCTPRTLVAAAIICAILPFDMVQLVFMVIGALCYSLVRMPMLRKSPAGKKPSSSIKPAAPPWRSSSKMSARVSNGAPRMYLSRRGSETPSRSTPSAREAVPNVKTPTAKPIAPAFFISEGWEGEVSELLEQLTPKPESNALVNRVAATVNASISRLFPGADVVGLASMDFRSSSAFGVAAPEVEIVIRGSPDIFTRRCGPRTGESDTNKVEKSAMRSITERLVSESKFKFRRSAFQGSEPKVTLLAPRWDGVEGTFPIELSINSTSPFRNMALVNECKRLDSRFEGLSMLVRRWTKDRAICHVPKGHLPRFQWNLLVAYFMQVGNAEENAQLPPLSFQGVGEMPTAVPSGEQMSVAALFKAFVRFYNNDFEWGGELVSVCLGKRTLRNVRTSTSINIKDPFDASIDLGDCINPTSYKRLREELVRANALCDRHGSLAELLELWAPEDEATQEAAKTDIAKIAEE